MFSIYWWAEGLGYLGEQVFGRTGYLGVLGVERTGLLGCGSYLGVLVTWSAIYLECWLLVQRAWSASYLGVLVTWSPSHLGVLVT